MVQRGCQTKILRESKALTTIQGKVDAARTRGSRALRHAVTLPVTTQNALEDSVLLQPTVDGAAGQSERTRHGFGGVKMTGAMYNLETGAVEFFD